jgi:hypothetical protein
MSPIEGVVERYNQSAQLFRIRYASQRIGDDAEDLDLMTLQDVLLFLEYHTQIISHLR